MMDRRFLVLGAAKMLLVAPAAVAAAPAVREAAISQCGATGRQSDAIDALVFAFMRCAETNGVTIRLDYGRARLGRVGVGLIEPYDDPRGTKFERVCAAWSMLRSVPGGRERFVEVYESRLNGGPHSRKTEVSRRKGATGLASR